MSELYVLTGAAGHLGSTVLNQLVAAKKRVRTLLMKQDAPLALQNPSVENVYGDVTNPGTLEPLFENNDGSDICVIHTAGIVSIASHYDQKVYDVNVDGTKNIIEACKKHRVKKLVHVSSVHAIPEKPQNGKISETADFNPDEVTGLYAKTKAEATRLVLASAREGLDASVVHPSGIIGPNDRGKGHLTQLIIDFVRGTLTAAIKGGYDFVDVRDVAKGVISCCANGVQGGCYILSNRYYELKNLLGLLYAACKNMPVFDQSKKIKPVKTVLPLWFAKLSAPLAELYYKLLRQPPLYTAYSLHTLSTNVRFSHQKADAALGYSTRPMTQTLTDTILWLKAARRI